MEDCFVNKNIFRKMLPDKKTNKALDAGCGIGFWTIECLQTENVNNMYSCDLTEKAVELTKNRLNIYNLQSNVVVGNLEHLTFESNYFDFIICSGVIHHTPDTKKSVDELCRVLAPSGIAIISVYYKNIIHKNWNYLNVFGKILSKLGAKLSGRGREDIYNSNNIDDIIRLYDGKDNPIGKAYTKREFEDLLGAFVIIEIFYYFFPARSLPFKIPKCLHKILEKIFPFMIVAKLTKK